MSATRVLKTSAATLAHTFEVGETPTDSTTTVAVAVTDANGTAVTSGNATSAGVNTGTYTFPLPGQANLSLLSVAWSATIAGSAVVQTDVVEVVGAFFFTLTQGRDSDSSLSDPAKYPTDDLVLKRTEVEEECEAICDRAFVARYARVVLDGTGESDLVLKHQLPDRTIAHVRSIRSVKMAPRADGTFVAFDAGELAALQVADDGTLRRVDGAVFTRGFGNVIVELEYGLDGPPAELVQACLTRFRSRLNLNKTSIPDRASSFTVADGGTFRLDMPGAWKTGLPAVDAVYARYSRRSGAGPGAGGRAVPASRQLNYDPQYTSLFHGGRR
ncbi:MAG: hypothetical protein ACRDPR_17555 [Nocardioidaceae bacterium]